MYPIPILTRDIPGYLITPHTDTRWKGITVQLYLPQDDANTDIGTIFHEKLRRRLACRRRRRCALRPIPAMPSRSATTPGIRPIRCSPEVKTRDSILLTYFVDAGRAAASSATAASGWAISCSTKSATDCHSLSADTGSAPPLAAH